MAEIFNTPIAHHTLTAATTIRRRRKMLFAASAISPSTITITSSKSRTHQLHTSFLINPCKQHFSIKCAAKFPWMEHFNDPTKLIVFLNHTKGKLWKLTPDSVKQFPWKKAGSVALHEILILGKETLKWSSLAFFAFSFLSDILYSISSNKELMIPFGLLVGIFITKFFDEISQELMSDHKDGSIKVLMGISCFFILVKVISAYLSGPNNLLLHVANGGLLQVLWNWKENPKLDGEKSSSVDVSTSMSVDS